MFTITSANAADLRTSVLFTEPWGFYKEGHIAGIVPEIIQLIEQESGLTIEMSLKPYARAWQDLENGDTDFSCLVRSPEREKKFFQSPPLIEFSAIVVARKGITLKRYEDLFGLNIGIISNIQLSPIFDQDIRFQKTAVRDYEILATMLQNGRVDAIAGNNISIFYLLKKAKKSELFTNHFTLQTMQASAQFSKNYHDPNKRRRVNQAILKIKKRGQIKAILNRWLEQSSQ